MRATLVIALCLLATGIGATERLGPAPSCEAYPPARPQCGCGNPNGCQRCNPCCQPPCGPPKEGPPKEGPPPGEPVETGVYLAPPRSGVTRGPVSYRGVEGASITFPELRLKLPSIQLPSCFHDRSGARMIVDSAVAPWESHGYVNANAARNEAILREQVRDLQDRGATGVDDRAARDAAENHLKSTQDELERLRCEVDRLRQLDDCIRQYQRDLEQNPGCQQNSRDGSPIQKGSYYQSARPVPPPDFGANRRLPPVPQGPSDLDARLQQLEQAESRIDEKLAALQAAYQRSQGSMPVSLQQPQPTQQLEAIRPDVRPLPIQPQYTAPHNTVPQYVERPVTYISEPQRLHEPQRLPISEPRSPTARITGFQGQR